MKGLAVLFGALISKFVARRQEMLTEEIHRLSFENRLGRVQTNLNLVIADLQNVARACRDGDLTGKETTTRVESLIMIFFSELRAVHDLLYRPQETPDEQTLEQILVSLASALEVLIRVMDCIELEPDRSAPIRQRLSSISRVATEICGECVPHSYAPNLRRWMDRVQTLARGVA